jgi:UDP-glucose:(heptosyl)LPS alpha-1,3-glucosyltransferase
MLNVAVIIERADISLGGAERSILELNAELSNIGIHTTLLAAAGKANLPNLQVLCPNTTTKRTTFEKFEQSLRNHLYKNNYDIIHSTLPFSFAHVYQPRGGTYIEAIMRNAQSYTNPITRYCKRITHRTNMRRTALLKAEKKLCQPNVHTAIAALSDYVRTQFKQHYNLNDNRIKVIPNGVKTDLQIDKKKSASLRTRLFALYGIPGTSEPAILLFAANNFRLKGLNPLIKALSLIAKSTQPAPIYLAVAGKDNPAKYKHLAAKLGVEKHIAFLGPLSDIQNALSITTTAVLPTFYDPCSRFILEALALSKPVITTKFNGAAERFTEERHGRILNDPYDIKALADAIAHYAHPANAKKTSNNILEDNFKDNISITTHAKKLLHLYKSILNKTGDK